MPLVLPNPGLMSRCERKCKCRGGETDGYVYLCDNPCDEGQEWKGAYQCKCQYGWVATTITRRNVGTGGGEYSYYYTSLTSYWPVGDSPKTVGKLDTPNWEGTYRLGAEVDDIVSVTYNQIQDCGASSGSVYPAVTYQGIALGTVGVGCNRSTADPLDNGLREAMNITVEYFQSDPTP